MIYTRAQWLSGRVLDSRPKGHGFEPHRHHCVVSLSKVHYLCLVLVQARKTKRLLTGIKRINSNMIYTRKRLISTEPAKSRVLLREQTFTVCLINEFDMYF